MIIDEFPDAKMMVTHPHRSGKQNKIIDFLRPILFDAYPATKAPRS
jgi:hypothetical protein